MPIPNAPAWEPWLGLLQKVSLFRGISPDDLCRLLLQLSPTVQRYPAGDIILLSGQENASIRIVLEGSITASKISPGGQTVTMAHMQPGGIFGDVLSGSSTPSPVTVTAAAPCTVLALPYERLMLPGCSDAAHCVLLRNLVEAISDKYFSLCLAFRAISPGRLCHVFHPAYPCPAGRIFKLRAQRPFPRA